VRGQGNMQGKRRTTRTIAGSRDMSDRLVLSPPDRLQSLTSKVARACRRPGKGAREWEPFFRLVFFPVTKLKAHQTEKKAGKCCDHGDAKCSPTHIPNQAKQQLPEPTTR
jgi:hypothetical protein